MINSVVSLAWSPAGLAKHDRCALAVLTSNHVLSIWISDGDVKNERSWKRVLIVNEGCDTPKTAQSGHDTRLKFRCRAFTWAPGLLTNSKLGPTSQGQDLPYMLAFTNDRLEVMLVELTSPWTHSSSANPSWSAQVRTVISISSNMGSALTQDESLTFLLARKHADDVAWSSWTRGDDSKSQLNSFVAYSVNGQLLCRRVTYDTVSGTCGLSNDLTEISVTHDYTGPMEWSTAQNDAIRLAAMTSSELLCVSFSEAKHVDVARKKLQDDLSDVTALGFVGNDENGHDLVLARKVITRNTRQSAQPVRTTWPIQPSIEWRDSSWTSDVEEHIESFDRFHNLNGNVLTRVRGFDVSPNQDLVAVLTSMHPSDMHQHIQRSEEHSILTISCEMSAQDVDFCAPGSRGYSLASAGLSILVYGDAISSDGAPQWLNLCERLNKPGVEYIQAQHQGFVARVEPYFSGFREEAAVLATASFTRLLCAQLAQRRTVMHEGVESTTHMILNSLLKLSLARVGHPLPNDIIQTAEAKQLDLVAIVISAQILTMYTRTPQSGRVSSMTHSICNAIVQRALHSLGVPRELEAVTEQCEICDAAIPFEDLQSARCAAGHRMGARDLKDLPSVRSSIPERGPSRREGDFAYGNVLGSEASPAHQHSLVDMLSKEYPFCVYCGGKFIG
ncbi:hypothetical protein MRB53_038508 [Persea americana]|nr:hypothetical protein MRB53_038508 [Persea americana]